MHDAFHTFIEGLRDSVCVDGLQAVLADAIAGFDLKPYAYLALPARPADQVRLISTYPRTWTDHYLRERYESVDPVITIARTRTKPFQWGRDSASFEMSQPQRQLFDEAAGFGIRSGVTIPIHDKRGRFAAMTFAADERPETFQRSIETNLRTLQLIAIAFHATVRRGLAVDRVVDGVVLTAREFECLQWAARGKSAWDIGSILGITDRTVEFHLDNARAKLGVRTRGQAIARMTLCDR